MRIAEQKNPAELYFLTDAFEMCDEFASYSDMMDFLADQNEDDASAHEESAGWTKEYPQVHYLLRTAANYMASYETLPGHIQGLLNRSLNMQVQLLINHLRQSCHENILKAQP